MLSGLVVGAEEASWSRRCWLRMKQKFVRIRQGRSGAGAPGGRDHNVQGEGSGKLAQERLQPWPPVMKEKARSTVSPGVRGKATFNLYFQTSASCMQKVPDFKNSAVPWTLGFCGSGNGSNQGHRVVDPNRRLEATRVPCGSC